MWRALFKNQARPKIGRSGLQYRFIETGENTNVQVHSATRENTLHYGIAHSREPFHAKFLKDRKAVIENKLTAPSEESISSSTSRIQVILARPDQNSVLKLSEAIQKTQIQEGRRVWTSLLAVPLLIPSFMAVKYVIDPQYRQQVHQVFTAENLEKKFGIKFKKGYQPAELPHTQSSSPLPTESIATEAAVSMPPPTDSMLDSNADKTDPLEIKPAESVNALQIQATPSLDSNILEISPLAIVVENSSTEYNPASCEEDKKDAQPINVPSTGEKDTSDPVSETQEEIIVAKNGEETNQSEANQQSNDRESVDSSIPASELPQTQVSSNPIDAQDLQMRPLISDDISEAIAEVEAYEAKTVSGFWKQPITSLQNSDDGDERKSTTYGSEEADQYQDKMTNTYEAPARPFGFAAQRPVVRKQYLVQADPERHFQARLRKLERNPPSASENPEKFAQWKAEVESLRKILGL
eukprot:TRINITY_DN1738_c0_g1_i1.p1 TRINITY_DN1738_c0_g1~~TRINITY_DN1738_c0_g1_i1.p1  ORF type:complete len:468 (-),score=87.88 TRINITY_DN1738_c0_g1_i1:370-1773(-)